MDIEWDFFDIKKYFWSHYSFLDIVVVEVCVFVQCTFICFFCVQCYTYKILLLNVGKSNYGAINVMFSVFHILSFPYSVFCCISCQVFCSWYCALQCRVYYSILWSKEAGAACTKETICLDALPSRTTKVFLYSDDIMTTMSILSFSIFIWGNLYWNLWWFQLVFTASREFKIFTETFIREYFRLQDRIKHFHEWIKYTRPLHRSKRFDDIDNQAVSWLWWL